MRWWLYIGIALGFFVMTWGINKASRAQTPTPLGEIKREPYSPETKPPAKTYPPAKPPQARVQRTQGILCGYVPNGDAVTLSCNNGYWHTIMPDGTVLTGNGMQDPNATSRGSGIVIDGGTGGPSRRGDATVTAPTQIVPTPGPGQGYYYGLPNPQQ